MAMKTMSAKKTAKDPVEVVPLPDESGNLRGDPSIEARTERRLALDEKRKQEKSRTRKNKIAKSYVRTEYTSLVLRIHH